MTTPARLRDRNRDRNRHLPGSAPGNRLPGWRASCAHGLEALHTALAVLLFVASAIYGDPAGARNASTPRAADPAATPLMADSFPAQAGGPPDETTIYRCANAYSSHPCGDTPPLDLADPRTPAQRQQAQEVAARDKRLAAWLRAQRIERETPASAPKKARQKSVGKCAATSAAACKPRARKSGAASSNAPSSDFKVKVPKKTKAKAASAATD